MLRFDGVRSLEIRSLIQMGAARAGKTLNLLTFVLESSWSINCFTLKTDFSARMDS